MNGINYTNDTTLAITLTVDQFRMLVREELKEVIGGSGNGRGELLTPEQLSKRLNVPLSHIYEQSRQGKELIDGLNNLIEKGADVSNLDDKELSSLLDLDISPERIRQLRSYFRKKARKLQTSRE